MLKVIIFLSGLHIFTFLEDMLMVINCQIKGSEYVLSYVKGAFKCFTMGQGVWSESNPVCTSLKEK